jgi:glutamate synthase (NADPH/NADH) small chain
MLSRLQGFLTVRKCMPERRAPEARRQDFGEIYNEFDDSDAAAQASRCSQCGIPFCQLHCPLSNNIPDWLRLTAQNRLEEAYEVASATNNFPEICGRICPQDRLCEGNCVIEKGFESVTIGSIERYITETAFERGWVRPPSPPYERKESVGIIGAGPAGLAAAEELRRRGYQVHVYDRHDRVGGLMIYGIPNFKLDKSVVERRSALLAQGGVTFHTEFEVGRDATLAELRDRHDAILVAVGVYGAREITVPGAGLGNVAHALPYLIASNRVGLGDHVPSFEDGTFNADGRDVVVVGGGDTAMDCVRTAVRQGAKSVKCLYRRDRENMPGSMREVFRAEEEGVEFVWLAQPQAFLGDQTVRAVRAARMHLGVADASGRRVPHPIEGSNFDVPATLVLNALGFEPEDLPKCFDEPDLGVTRWGTLKVDFRTMMTNLDGVFAAGDIVRGASLVVWAIRDGRDAAACIHTHIQAQQAASPARDAAE